MSDNDVLELKKRVLQMASYSKLKANHTADTSELKVVDESEEIEEEEVQDPDAWGFIEPNHLPGGTKAGSMIHEVLEFVDFRFAASCSTAEQWSEDAKVKALVESTMQKYRFDVEAYWDDVIAMLWGTLHANVSDGFDGWISPLSSLDTSRVKREVRFVFPIPEKGRASRRQTKGFAEGFVDLLFEHQGRMYFADWKTDVLEHGDYSRRKLARRVRESYPAQATIYTLAITRMLGINNAEDFERKFGGFYYFFVRGMKRADEGVYYERPTWEMVSTMDAELAGSDRHSWAELLAGGWR
jgi:exodeoxyribonuclease V beta subunit